MVKITFEEEFGLLKSAEFKPEWLEVLKHKCKHDRVSRVGYRDLLDKINNFEKLTPRQKAQVERQWAQFVDYEIERTGLWKGVGIVNCPTHG